MKLSFLGLFLILALALIGFSFQQPSPSKLPNQGVSGPPHQEAPSTKQQTNNQQKDSEKPVSINDQGDASYTNTEPKRHYAEEQEKRSKGWGIGDKIAAIVAGIGFFQFMALCATYFIMRNTAIRQLRAYVFINGIIIGNISGVPPSNAIRQTPIPFGPWVFQPEKGPVVMISLKNSGQTPAYEVTYRATLGYREYPLGEKPLVPAPLPPFSSKSTMPPGAIAGHEFEFPAPLDDARIDALKKGTAAIYVFGKIFYRDAFKKKRFSNFRFIHNNISGPIGKTTAMTVCENGNETN